MIYECQHCKSKRNTVESYLHCSVCGNSLEESIRIADARAAEERRSLARDAERRRVGNAGRVA